MSDKEAARVAAVKALKATNFEQFTEFRTIVALAAEICESPVALLTLLDDETNFFVAKVGVDTPAMPRDTSFCQYTILQDGLMIVDDTLLDERFATAPLVAQPPNVRFYAGCTLSNKDGHRLGTLCVIDLQPKILTEMQRKTLKMLATQATLVLDLHVQQSLLNQQVQKVQEYGDLLRDIVDVQTDPARSSVLTMANILEIIKKDGYTSAYKNEALMQEAIKRGEEASKPPESDI